MRVKVKITVKNAVWESLRRQHTAFFPVNLALTLKSGAALITIHVSRLLPPQVASMMGMWKIRLDAHVSAREGVVFGAATNIQAHYRGHSTRRKLVMVAAARCIQVAFRGDRQRRRESLQRSSQGTLKAAMFHRRSDMEVPCTDSLEPDNMPPSSQPEHGGTATTSTEDVETVAARLGSRVSQMALASGVTAAHALAPSVNEEGVDCPTEARRKLPSPPPPESTDPAPLAAAVVAVERSLVRLSPVVRAEGTR